MIDIHPRQDNVPCRGDPILLQNPLVPAHALTVHKTQPSRWLASHADGQSGGVPRSEETEHDVTWGDSSSSSSYPSSDSSSPPRRPPPPLPQLSISRICGIRDRPHETLARDPPWFVNQCSRERFLYGIHVRRLIEMRNCTQSDRASGRSQHHCNYIEADKERRRSMKEDEPL